ncbi:anti-sigma factor [Paenibacillus sp. R14(2021)]|uniref:anti-sigma factor n=1 Tax=Paenibacillus sp. R14(2021) TaxID=2859228 RepID=UPI001C613521|nr:anti-sigma factor [Paenibacillus sp. R14(2021)]
MTERGRLPACEHSLDYLAGLCSEEDKFVFERHLPHCASCQQELEELRFVWEALPAHMELMEPPVDLKQQVMDAALTAEVKRADNGSNSRPLPAAEAAAVARRPWFGRKSAAALFSAAAAVILLLSLWNIQLRSEQNHAPLPIEEALSVSAAQITHLVKLQSKTPEATDSSGVACIVDNGHSKQFVTYIFGAAATTGSEAYQVWLIKDGKRSSAGTFRIGASDRGIGLLAMPIKGDGLDFDAVGITLEPDDRGSQPRGMKVYGSV